MNRLEITALGKWYRLKSRSIERGFDFNVQKDDFINWWNQQPKNCWYCGQIVVQRNGFKQDNLTIDRADNKKGYSLDNIHIVCRRCNMIKGSWFTESQMFEIARKYFMKEGSLEDIARREQTGKILERLTE